MAMIGNLLPTLPPLCPSDKKRVVTKNASNRDATTAENTPVMTPTNTSLALHHIPSCFAPGAWSSLS